MTLAAAARLAGLSLALAAAGCASMDPLPAAADDARSAAAFERMKGLAGAWKGEMAFGPDRMPATVEYRVTSGGTAVEEILGRGGPYEMVTLYHRDGTRLLLTHYCAAGNQPTMVLAPGDDPAVLHFDFLRASNLKTPGEGHMHEATFEFPAPDRLKTTWTYWEDGKPGMAATMDMKRAKP